MYASHADKKGSVLDDYILTFRIIFNLILIIFIIFQITKKKKIIKNLVFFSFSKIVFKI